MEPDAKISLVVTRQQLMLLQAGLKAYLQVFQAHRLEDAGDSHPESQFRDIQRQVGQLLWRLEEAGAVSPDHLQHSSEAVQPDM